MLWLRQLSLIGPASFFALGSFALVIGSVPRLGVAQWLYASAVAVNMGLLALSSWSGILGAAVALWERCGGRVIGPTLASPTGAARTAVLMPVYEEDPIRIFAAAGLTADALAKQRTGPIDIFILSDTQSPAGAAREEETASRFFAARPRAAAGAPSIYYRRRARNSGRKAGNIADFCARWGEDYDFMLVLDADSLMSGPAIAELVGAMEANPRAGLIQTMCYPVGRVSLFARLQQFGARLNGPLLAKGVAFWQGPHGSYWGHNAILRLAAFTAHCGLPVLPGRAPLGGEILCHDTVEAALMLRAGWDVWMIPHGLDGEHRGSWEETPTNLIDHLERDKRWCQGNLQHGSLLQAEGLRAASLMHLGQGILHYLSAPLFFCLLILSAFAGSRGSLRADHALLGSALGLMLAPRLLALGAALSNRDGSRGFGGRATLLASAALDQLFGLLIGPVTLTFYTAFVVSTLAGRVVRWDRQPRDDRGLSWSEAWVRLAAPLGIAVILAMATSPWAPLVAITLLPGLVLGGPLAVWTSRPSLGRLAGRFGLFRIPEETHVPSIFEDLAAAEAALRTAPDVPGSIVVLPRGRGRPVEVQDFRPRGLRLLKRA